MTVDEAQIVFRDRILAILAARGAAEGDWLGYSHVLATPAGPLWIRVKENWVFCRFEDNQRGYEATRPPRANRFSGKWNFHYHDDAETLQVAADDFEFHLDRIDYPAA